jgi:hypothetical protein
VLRLSYFGALVAAATLLSGATLAQTSKQTSAQVQHVIVRGSGDAMEVEIQTAGSAVAPETQAITGPDRIVVDFPGATPAAELRALKVNRGALKGVRSGLFFSNPPITRIVLDLNEPQSYRISTIQNAVLIKLGGAKPGSAPEPTAAGIPRETSRTPAAKLHAASLTSSSQSATTTNAARVSAAVQTTAPSTTVAAVEAPLKPQVTVTFVNGLLRIRAERATLAQVLFEVQRQTQAEIAIPAGAEQEEVVADLGPAPARDVLGSLLNGSPYNFIFVGNELSLEKVILTRRDSSLY